MKACQWLQAHICSCKVKSGVGPSLLKRPPAQGLQHMCHTCIWGVFTKSPAGRSMLNHFKPGNITFGVGTSRLMMNTPLMDEQDFYMLFPLILDFGPYVSLEEVHGPTCRGSDILNVAVER